ncbi:MAG: Gfo/Idh/MocA family oxidoreductase [Verrucomicrobiae bacterium]|nr:Gfo/Idh/MocA family oxidoreductase [Verrucomicrobiae bacterium]
MRPLSRRKFLGAVVVSSATLSRPPRHAAQTGTPAARRKIKLGLIGCGKRGKWIAQLFRQHGGYEIHAVADYFPHVADAAGNELGTDKARRFSGLHAYKRLIESGVEAVALETPPYFFPEHATAAVAAGLHVYMAKPVAVDVPGCLAIEAAGKLATEKQRVFLVDYQMPTDPFNQGVVQRIHEGGLGKIAYMTTFGFTRSYDDPPLTETIESRLQNLTWINDIALGCDYIGNFDIHAIDAALWVAGTRPVSAFGASRICRDNPNGDAHDVCQVVFEFADGLLLNHSGQALNNNVEGMLTCRIYGPTAYAQIEYWGRAFLRGGPKHYGGGPVQNLYKAGAERNIAAFYDAIVNGDFGNPTVRRSVDGCLTCILGREAAARHTKLTMDQILKENKKLEVNLKGLKP